MITVDVPRAVAWTRVARGRKKSQTYPCFDTTKKWFFFDTTTWLFRDRIGIGLISRGVRRRAARPAMTRFGRSTVGSELFVTHDVAREEAFIDAFASLRATATLDAHDEHFDTYLAIQDELLRAETERHARGEPAPLTKTRPRRRVAARVILALGADRDDVERHCARLAFDYGLVHLSASALTRAHVARETRGVAVFERWDAVLRRNEWCFSTDLTLRLLREAVRTHGDETKLFIVDWFPANLDQAREFETRVAPVDFAIFFDVEPPPEVGVAGGPDDPEDRDRKAYEAFAAKHAVVLNEYKSNGMVHHVRSPPDRAHVTLAPSRAATVGPMRRGFYRGERVPRDVWTAKDRPDWTWHDDTQGSVRLRIDYEHEATYAACRVAMRAEKIQPADPATRLAASLRGASEEEQDAAARDDESARAVRALRQAASDVLQSKELEATIGRRVDRLIEAGYG